VSLSLSIKLRAPKYQEAAAWSRRRSTRTSSSITQERQSLRLRANHPLKLREMKGNRNRLSCLKLLSLKRRLQISANKLSSDPSLH
jgi:hypothetical protein